MIGFVIPFKSRLKSKEWRLDCALLNRTIGSVLNQKSENFKCYVVYSDIPDNPVQHQKVQWIQFPFPFLESHQIEDEEKYVVRYGLGKNLPFFYDQGKKIMYGCSFAKKDGCRFIMSLDSDDLLSNKLVTFIENSNQPENCGWYINKGYRYVENKRLLIKTPKGMNYVCGSVNIVNSDLIPIPDFSKKTYNDFQFFSSHSYMEERMQLEHNKQLLPIPFYSLVYVIHTTNFMARKKDIEEINVKNILKKIIRGKLITTKVRTEFGIYKLAL
ncbi:MAG TPA: hypothetical protein VM888_13010 [Chitinophagaceae bacterium]|jgi:hypothetical protein|nr:hypothetical protein [Chitinophagaceae bacterium]